jgi:DNA-binding NarL/FixJ family response regulator
MKSRDLASGWPTARQCAAILISAVTMSTADGNLPTIRIVIAEGQAVVRRAVAFLLSTEADMEVIGQACNGVEAIELAQLLRPDIILMDLHMPIKGGVAATREISQALPNTKILVLTTLSDDETVFEAVRAGAQAYLLKDAAESELLDTIRGLRRGESYLTPQIARKVMDQVRRLTQVTQSEEFRHSSLESSAIPSTSETSDKPLFAEALNEKEEAILHLIAEGFDNHQIGKALCFSESAVKGYVTRIVDKVHANTRAGIAILSRTHRSPVK